MVLGILSVERPVRGRGVRLRRRSRAAAWARGVQRVERGGDGRLRVRYRLLGRTVDYEASVTEYRSPRRYSLSGVSPRDGFRSDFILAPGRGGSTIPTDALEAEVPTRLEVVEPILERLYRRVVDTYLDGLRDELEAGREPPSGKGEP